jgi:hypothetical protein
LYVFVFFFCDFLKSFKPRTSMDSLSLLGVHLRKGRRLEDKTYVYMT